MKLSIRNAFICLSLAGLSGAASGPAFATLGEGADSVAKDRQALAASKRAMKTQANYTVQEVTSDAVTVREFIAPSGIVFAVAWDGLVHPDLTTLLGSYYQEYQSSKQQGSRPRGRKQARVTSDNIVVETWGHMRNLQGRAYVPALVPAGVNLNEIH